MCVCVRMYECVCMRSSERVCACISHLTRAGSAGRTSAVGCADDLPNEEIERLRARASTSISVLARLSDSRGAPLEIDGRALQIALPSDACPPEVGTAVDHARYAEQLQMQQAAMAAAAVGPMRYAPAASLYAAGGPPMHGSGGPAMFGPPPGMFAGPGTLLFGPPGR